MSVTAAVGGYQGNQMPKCIFFFFFFFGEGALESALKLPLGDLLHKTEISICHGDLIQLQAACDG